MKKQSVIDQIEILRDGNIQVRMALEILDDDGTVLSKAYHRTAMPPGHDINAQMNAVNAHLGQMRHAPVTTGEISRLHAVAGAIWTPGVVKAHRDRSPAELPTRT